MDKKEKIEELKYIIGRFDHYYEGINTKGNFYLAINTFILGSMIAGYSSISGGCKSNYCCMILFVLLLMANLVSFFYTLMSVKPYLNTKRDNENGSLLFFGDVADYHSNQHKKRWEDLTPDLYFEDLVKQSSLLALGLKNKFQYLNIAIWAIAIQTIFAIIFSMVFLNQLK